MIESHSVIVRFWRDYKNGQKVLTRCAITSKESSVTTVATVGLHPNDSFDILKGRLEALWKAANSKRVTIYDAAGQIITDQQLINELRPKVSEYEMALIMEEVAYNRAMELGSTKKIHFDLETTLGAELNRVGWFTHGS